MKPRTLKWMAVGVGALALIDLALAIPALRTAARMGDFRAESGTLFLHGHDVYVRHMFGFPWWLTPTVLTVIAVALFVLARFGVRR